MPDRYGDNDDLDEPPDDLWAAEQRAADAAMALVRCNLCDDDGYTASLQVCDHVEHSTPAGRAAAMAIIRATLGNGDT